jgi:hypothetical protein
MGNSARLIISQKLRNGGKATTYSESHDFKGYASFSFGEQQPFPFPIKKTLASPLLL